jgi:hypothetical protein
MTTPAEPPNTHAKEAGSRSSTSFAGWVARSLWMAAGAGLLLGFFLPWFSVGQTASVSGLGLLATSGDLVQLVTGPHRFLLFSVPLLGVALVVSSAMGHRAAAWTALLTGAIILGGGLYTMVRLFFDTTGFGMWLVVGSALLALVVALLVVGSEKK